MADFLVFMAAGLYTIEPVLDLLLPHLFMLAIVIQELLHVRLNQGACKAIDSWKK